jgi:HSP20 family protein
MYPSLTTARGDLFAEFDAMQRQLDRILGWSEWPSSIRAVARGSFPAINMGTTGEAVEIYAFVPGVDPAKIEVSVDKGLLSITGERTEEAAPENEKTNVYTRERFTGTFRRVVSLPEDVDSAKVDATYRNGVLKILVPKRESVKPRRIEVKELAHQQ